MYFDLHSQLIIILMLAITSVIWEITAGKIPEIYRRRHHHLFILFFSESFKRFLISTVVLNFQKYYNRGGKLAIPLSVSEG